MHCSLCRLCLQSWEPWDDTEWNVFMKSVQHTPQPFREPNGERIPLNIVLIVLSWNVCFTTKASLDQYRILELLVSLSCSWQCSGHVTCQASAKVTKSSLLAIFLLSTNLFDFYYKIYLVWDACVLHLTWLCRRLAHHSIIRRVSTRHFKGETKFIWLY